MVYKKYNPGFIGGTNSKQTDVYKKFSFFGAPLKIIQNEHCIFGPKVFLILLNKLSQNNTSNKIFTQNIINKIGNRLFTAIELAAYNGELDTFTTIDKNTTKTNKASLITRAINESTKLVPMNITK